MGLTKQPWKQEVIWVQRFENGAIAGVSEKLPATENFVPNLYAGETGKRKGD